MNDKKTDRRPVSTKIRDDKRAERAAFDREQREYDNHVGYGIEGERMAWEVERGAIDRQTEQTAALESAIYAMLDCLDYNRSLFGDERDEIRDIGLRAVQGASTDSDLCSQHFNNGAMCALAATPGTTRCPHHTEEK